MGVAIKCILEQRIPNAPRMEGKSLAMGYCSEAAAGADAANPDIIAIDFKSGQTKTPPPAATPHESILSPLEPFIVGDDGIEWHDAAKGLAAIRGILIKLRKGAIIAVTPDFEFNGGGDDLTAGVVFDLEELEKILLVAEKQRTRFYLTFDV